MKTLLVEYDAGVSVEHLLSYGLKMTDLLKAVEAANKRVSNSLKIERNVLSISNGKVKASGVAGIIKLNSDIELEIMPKFIVRESAAEWRATLYLLSALSKHGNIMISERIKANASHTDSLYDMAGRMLAEEYLANRRKPVRKYRKEKYTGFVIDGDIDFDSYFEINPNGYKQSRVRFDKVNIFNATIVRAMQIVLPYVSDIKAKNILSTAVGELGNQNFFNLPKQKVPTRNKEWENAYNLSYDIVQGLGASYEVGKFYAPGFVANTWQMWEWLITTAATIGTKDKKVISQKCSRWGTKKSKDKEFAVNVFPDVAVYDKNSMVAPEYLVDAKYKLLVNEATGEIERSDLYEAYAFCKSLQTNTIFLAYPIQAEDGITLGTIMGKTLYEVSDIKVYVVMVAFGNIRERGGIYTFSKCFVEGIEGIIKK